jgi:hypothetical protein
MKRHAAAFRPSLFPGELAERLPPLENRCVANERVTEIRRRRSRRKKLAKLKKKLDSATVSERKEIASRLRKMTPGAAVVIANWGLEERKV